MEQVGLRFRRHRNCFTWIEDSHGLRSRWIAVHPLFPEICKRYPMEYYWTCADSEWAMDLIFRDAQQLRRLYPQLVHLGMTSFSSPDVLRFMGKRVRTDGTTVGVHELPIIS